MGNSKQINFKCFEFVSPSETLNKQALRQILSQLPSEGVFTASKVLQTMLVEAQGYLREALWGAQQW